MEIKRQTLDAFDVQIAYDKGQNHIEISATVYEAVPDALENEKPSEERTSASLLTR